MTEREFWQGKANKYDEGKPAMDLLVPKFLLGLGDVMAHGAKKYGRNNWRQGIDTNRLYAAAQRHMNQYHAGEVLDKDSGLNHLLHAAANMMMEYWYDCKPDREKDREKIDDLVREIDNMRCALETPLELTEFKANGQTYYHSPELKSWQEWMDWAEFNDYELLDSSELYSMPYETLATLPNMFNGFRHHNGGRRDDYGETAFLWSADCHNERADFLYLKRRCGISEIGWLDKDYGFSVILKRKQS